MKSVLLIGLGRYGYNVSVKLHDLGHDVLAIDKSEKRVNAALPVVTDAQIGDATDLDLLKSLGIKNFEVCIVAIGNDFQSSLEITSLLKELGASLVVARASSDLQEKLLKKIGADEVVYPEKQLGDWTAIRYTSDHVTDYIEIDSDHSIFEVTVPDAWKGKTLGELDVRKKYGINVLGVKENGKIDFAISAGCKLDGEKTLMVLGKFKDLKKCFKI